ncbi:hypothetical protein PQQ96_23820 [Paraburkholderia sediminicola]|uniref:hypothetical protein n=1 Tax=Paraburkholderia sediminicola TaxID=458836 RepID=UPI0038BC810B
MSVTIFRATELAAQVVAAAAQAGNLKLDGVPMDGTKAQEAGEKDGKYVAALIKTIAEGIKT